MKALQIKLRKFEELSSAHMVSRVRVRFHLDKQWWKLRGIWFEFLTDEQEEMNLISSRDFLPKHGHFNKVDVYHLDLKYKRLNKTNYFMDATRIK